MYKLTPQKPIYKAHRSLSRADRMLIVFLIMFSSGFIYIAYRIAMFLFGVK